MNYRKEKGQSLVETGLVLSLVSLVAIGSLSVLGKLIQENFKATVTRYSEVVEISNGDNGDGETGGDKEQCQNAGGVWVEGWDPPCLYP
ncbi:MAG: hypothetical protein A2Y25_02475 [Candidatus Melainabacteria bacterium GWF2_37_15]|nr:MAG: hypothetical protein A2Y25_02475 [Candidatus Melainabacteria bacterium GWF2_37_15]